MTRSTGFLGQFIKSKFITIYDHIRFVYRIEIFLGKLCSLSDGWRYICVSNSMKKWIMKNFITKNDKIDVLYDRPSEKYVIFSEKERQIVNIIIILIY